MIKFVVKLTLRLSFVLFALGLAVRTYAAVEDNSIMALGPLDGRVVVKTAEGKMQVLKIGDTLPGSNAVIKQVMPDKVVAEEMVGEDNKVKQTLWLYKPAKPGGKTVVKRLDGRAPPRKIKQQQIMLEAKPDKKQ